MEGLMAAYAFVGRLPLLQDDRSRQNGRLRSAGKQELRGPMPFLEDPPITRAWLLLAKGDGTSAGAWANAL